MIFIHLTIITRRHRCDHNHIMLGIGDAADIIPVQTACKMWLLLTPTMNTSNNKRAKQFLNNLAALFILCASAKHRRNVNVPDNVCTFRTNFKVFNMPRSAQKYIINRQLCIHRQKKENEKDYLQFTIYRANRQCSNSCDDDWNYALLMRKQNDDARLCGKKKWSKWKV